MATSNMGATEAQVTGAPASGREERLKGLALSEGCAVGRVCMFSEQRHISVSQYKVPEGDVDSEIKRLEESLDAVTERLASIRERVEHTVGKAEAEIFVAQRLVVEDAALRRAITSGIAERGLNAEAAVAQTLDQYESRLAALGDDYLKERAGDLGEVKRRILNALADTNPTLVCANEEHCRRGRGRIVVAEELTPSVTVDLNTEHLLGFATEHGGVNSHAAILARALGIPAVSGLHDIRNRVSCGTEILVDGDAGEIVIWPSEQAIAAAHAASVGPIRLPGAVDEVPGFTVLANIGGVAELQLALDMKAEGIGLYRTEIEMIRAGRLLDEDTLAEHYGHAVRCMNGRRVIFRMLDVGSDKPPPAMEMPREENPALGRRGARFLLARTDLLRSQARALARAAACGPVHVMYPMVTGVEQFLRLRELFANAVADLPAEEILHGVMLEVPSACFQVSSLLREVDFASVGTNDLIQYFFAVDRDNELVAADYDCDRPVFWDLLRSIVEAARCADKPLSLCGELAGEPRFIPRLLDLGFTCVSVTPRRISSIRQAARVHLGHAVGGEKIAKEG